MKINKSQAFVADLYKANNYRGYDTDFEVPYFDEELVKKDVVLVKYNSVYVAVKEIKNMISHLTFKFASKNAKSYEGKTFLHTEPNASYYYLKNIKSLNLSEVNEKSVDLSVLREFQEVYDLTNERNAKYEQVRKEKEQQINENANNQ